MSKKQDNKKLRKYVAEITSLLNTNSGEGTQGGLLRDSTREGLIKAGGLVSKVVAELPEDSPLRTELADCLVQDLEQFAKCPTNTWLVELSLWQRITELSDAVKSMAGNASKPDTRKDEQRTFRDFYVEAYADTFAADLAKVREADDDWDEGKVGLLVDCMETGLHAFGSLGRACFLKRPKAAKSRAGKEEKGAHKEGQEQEDAEEADVVMKADEGAKKSKKKKKVEKVEKVEKSEEAGEKKKTTKKKKRKNAEVS